MIDSHVHFQKLLDRLQTGDVTAAEELVEHYGPHICRAIRRRCRTRKLFNVPARAFTPPPNVESAVVSLTPHTSIPYPADQQVLERVTAAAFGQRRKMLRGSLKSLPADPAALLTAAEIDPTRRAETLDISEFASLARALVALTGPDAAP